MRSLFFVLTLALALTSGAPSIGSETAKVAKTTVTPHFDLRLRQEVFDGVLHFLPDPDHNQLRFRTRFGLTASGEKHAFKLLLANEFRRYIHPHNANLSWDELIIDQLWWRWADSETKLTVGRQNIIWDDGFIMLEGKPYDGSRSIYHNAVRLQKTIGTRNLELALIYNPKRDQVVLLNDQDRYLRDADETAVAFRYESGQHSASYIFKSETDPDGNLPDLTTHTLSGRATRGDKKGLYWMGEIVGQYQAWQDGTEEGVFALQTRAEFNLLPPARGEVGFFHYDNKFRAPWGRWPKWSELYIYTLIGESTPNRVHVAAWENIAAPFVGVSGALSDQVDGKIRAYYLLAPNPQLEARGTLLQARLNYKLDKRVSGHLLWEMLDPGKFHEAVPQLTKTVHFLRWEIIIKL